MINKLYAYTIGKHGEIYSLIRFLLRNYYNFIFPLQVQLKKKQSLSNDDKIIVSITSFPKRINKVWMVIETMFNQTHQPDKIVLTLSELQFKDKKIPKKLLEQVERGLEIIWTKDDIRSHKKYFYVMQKYPNSIIITIDDDILYEKSLIKKLTHFNSIYPNCILCNWGTVKKGNEYNNWENLLLQYKSPSYNVLQIGVGGVLYPPNSLYKDVFRKDIFLEICPLADDIWLNAMAILNDTQIVKTDYPFYYIPILYNDNTTLHSVNLGQNQNNKQIQNLIQKYGEQFASKFLVHEKEY